MTLSDGAEVIFVGGTRFSGAEAVARLLSEHPAATTVPSVARFHSDRWGIPAVLHGRTGLDDFADRLRSDDVAERIPRERLESALAALREGYQADPLGSSRALFWSVIDELVDHAAPPRTLVDASPGNLVEAQTLARLVPEARFVHVVHDGRDVAAAAVDSDVDVTRIPAGLEWWAGELREIERGVRGEEDGAHYAIQPERLCVAVLDELAGPEAGAAYARLLDRLSLGEDGPVTPVQAKLDPSELERESWRGWARGPGRRWATRRYERTLDELESEGNHAAPALRAAYERLG